MLLILSSDCFYQRVQHWVSRDEAAPQGAKRASFSNETTIWSSGFSFGLDIVHFVTVLTFRIASFPLTLVSVQTTQFTFFYVHL